MKTVSVIVRLDKRSNLRFRPQSLLTLARLATAVSEAVKTTPSILGMRRQTQVSLWGWQRQRWSGGQAE